MKIKLLFLASLLNIFIAAKYNPYLLLTAPPNIDAVTETTSPVNGTSGGTTASLLSNDTYNGQPVEVGVNVRLSLVSIAAGMTLNTDGTVNVPPGTSAGFYNVTYKISDLKDYSLSDTVQSIVEVVTPEVPDSDNDGITDNNDLDDDNDGISDDAEGCNIKQAELNKNVTYVGSYFAVIADAPGSNIVDLDDQGQGNLSTYMEFQKPQPSYVGRSWEDKTIFELNLNRMAVINRIKLRAFKGAGALGSSPSASAKLQGFDGSSWIDLSEPVEKLNSFNDKTFENTLASTQAVSRIRLVGVNRGIINFGTSNAKIAHVDVSVNEELSVNQECDTDGDGIPNRLDLDADNDGCLDVIEGGDGASSDMLVDAGGSVSVGDGSAAADQNLCASDSCIDSQGVPIIVNTGNTADIDNAQGQSVGTSQDSTLSGCNCFETPTTGTGLPVKHGITSLQRAGTGSNWPMVRTGAHTALEAKTKGFVINRMASPETAIVNPVEGMLVFDTDANAGEGCLKLYDGTSWDCLSNPTCPE